MLSYLSKLSAARQSEQSGSSGQSIRHKDQQDIGSICPKLQSGDSGSKPNSASLHQRCRSCLEHDDPFHHKRSDQSSSVLGLVRAIGRSRPRTVSVPQLPSPGPQRDKSGQVGESIGPICVEAFPPPVENPTTSISRASSRKIVCDSGIIKKAQPLLSFLPRFTNEYPYPNLT